MSRTVYTRSSRGTKHVLVVPTEKHANRFASVHTNECGLLENLKLHWFLLQLRDSSSAISLLKRYFWGLKKMRKFCGEFGASILLIWKHIFNVPTTHLTQISSSGIAPLCHVTQWTLQICNTPIFKHAFLNTCQCRKLALAKLLRRLKNVTWRQISPFQSPFMEAPYTVIVTNILEAWRLNSGNGDLKFRDSSHCGHLEFSLISYTACICATYSVMLLLLSLSMS